MALKLAPRIQENIDQFIGRTWLLPKVLDWYGGNQGRILLLTGGPGTGKSMIMAWLAGFGPLPDAATARAQLGQIRSQVKAAHFCIAASGTTAPKALAQNLAEQLTRQVPGFADALAASLAELVTITPIQTVGRMERGASMTGVQIGTLNLSGLGEELSFNRTLREPLQKLYQNGYDKPLLLLVDALDEALTYTGVIDIVRLLAKLKDLPEQVRFLVSARPDPRVLKRFREAKRVDLIEDAPPDVDDVQAYASGRLAKGEGVSSRSVRAFADRIAKAAGGIFLYAAIVLDELPRLPSLADLDLDRYPLPDGLSGLYYGFLNRELGQDEDRWYERFKPVLGLIAVAQGDGLTAKQLGVITGKEVEQTLRICRQYLSGEWPNGPFRCFHRSFVEWLLEDEENEAYHIDGNQMHRQIADHYWQAHHPDWRGCDAYGLDSLAIHLSRGGQTDRLRELISQPWMAARFAGSGYTYDGFIDDVMLAWQAAHKEAHEQIEADQAPAALGECVRYALIRTSVNSLSANYVPELVARAIETGLQLWPAERALSVAGRVPDPRQRTRMFAALLATGRLDPEQKAQAEQAGLEAGLAIGDEWFRASALAALASQLTGEARTEALAQGLEAALAIGDEWQQASTLAALAPHLTGEAQSRALARGLEAALAVRYVAYRASALAVLAPQLTGEALAQALEAALALGDEQYRARALAALAPQLTGETLARGLEAALAIANEGHRAEVLAALAPHLSGEARTQALTQGLEAALASEDEWPRAAALAALAPQLTGEAQTQALAHGLRAALVIANEWGRASTLAALAPQLTGEGRSRALAQGLEASLAIGAEVLRVRAVAALTPQLEAEAQTQALARGLEEALAIEVEGARAEALATLAPQLTGEALDRGLEAALAIQDERWQTRALAALAPELTGESRSRALAQGLEAALAIRSEWSRASALEVLVPQLNGEALARALEAALTIGNDGSRAEALAALAPQLTGEARTQALARGLDASLAIANEGGRARALATLAPQLTGEARSQAAAQGLEAALASADEGERARVLAALASQLSGQALARALAAAQAIRDQAYRAMALAALAPCFSGEVRNKVLAQGLEVALAIQDEWWQTHALVALAPQLTGEALTRALEAAVDIRDERRRAEALAALAPQLGGEALARGLAAALDIRREWSRACALAALAPQLRDEALARGLAAALALGEERPRARALTAFLAVGPSLVALRGARQAIADHLLKNLSAAEREEVLKFCADQKLFALPLLDQDILAAIAGHIVEVCAEWRWM
jgi:hypothetical protein